MESQKETFLNHEADQWYNRNAEIDVREESEWITQYLQIIEIKPERVLEIGCSSGAVLNQIHKTFGAECHGIDPSALAVKTGNEKFGLKLVQGTADQLPYEDGTFDLVIFGFSLYLCDRKDLFKIALEADRVLKNKGFLVIKDFFPPTPYKNKYVHHEGVYSYKMNYSKMFSWNPQYNEIFLSVFSHNGYANRDIPEEKVAVSILNKNIETAYPESIY